MGQKGRGLQPVRGQKGRVGTVQRDNIPGHSHCSPTGLQKGTPESITSNTNYSIEHKVKLQLFEIQFQIFIYHLKYMLFEVVVIIFTKAYNDTEMREKYIQRKTG